MLFIFINNTYVEIQLNLKASNTQWQIKIGSVSPKWGFIIPQNIPARRADSYLSIPESHLLVKKTSQTP